MKSTLHSHTWQVSGYSVRYTVLDCRLRVRLVIGCIFQCGSQIRFSDIFPPTSCYKNLQTYREGDRPVQRTPNAHCVDATAHSLFPALCPHPAPHPPACLLRAPAALQFPPAGAPASLFCVLVSGGHSLWQAWVGEPVPMTGDTAFPLGFCYCSISFLNST